MPKIQVSGGNNNWYRIDLNINKAPTLSSFEITFNHTTIADLDFQSAADAAALQIQENYQGRDLYIGLSGGVDSEFVADVFYRNKIKFTPIVSIIPGLTEYKYALYWCHKHQITPMVYDLHNNTDLVKVAAYALSRAPRAEFLHVAVGLMVAAKAIELGGVSLTGEPDLTYKTTAEFNSPIGNMLEMVVEDVATEICFSQHQLPGSFFWYTPELVRAYARELNTTVNYDIARSELYQVPYRPKQQQLTPNLFSTKDLNKLMHIYKFESYSPVEPITWINKDLVNQLNK